MEALRLDRDVKLHIVQSHAQNVAALSDEELISACQRDVPGAIDELFKRNKRLIKGMIHKLAPDLKDTSDLEQEAYIRIWMHIKNLRKAPCFRTWMCRIITNLYYDELRARPKREQIISIDEPVHCDDGSSVPRDIPDTRPEPIDGVLNDELAGVLTRAMDRIPEKFRTAVVLRDVEGYSYEQIAEMTNAELGTVKSRIARARGKILRHVQPYLKSAA